MQLKPPTRWPEPLNATHATPHTDGAAYSAEADSDFSG